MQNSLIDYPDNVCITVFTGGCNYRCPFCQNADLVLSPESVQTISLQDAISHIRGRAKYLDGITITGGEPLLNKDITELTGPVKEMGLKVKLDTNGTFPELLGSLVSHGQLDYVAMDIKTSPGKYALATGVESDIELVRRSAEILRSSSMDYEFRTTAVPGLVEREDLEEIGAWLKGAKAYFLQQFVPDKSLSKEYRALKPHPPEALLEFRRIAERYFLNVGVRGL